MKRIISITAILLMALAAYAGTSGEIIIYTNEGCSRCEFTVEYLKSNKIKFTEYDIGIEANNDSMWAAIEGSGAANIEKIKLPVIVKNGKVWLSIENLEEFVVKLKDM